MAPPPSVIVLGGPNGAGKSTAAPWLIQGLLGIGEFVNADVIAQGLSGFEPERVAMAAGRIMLERLKELGDGRTTFAFETTLASKSFAPRIAALRDVGYEFHLFFLWLPSAELAVCRVADRVRSGGHDVPEEIIRRRYNAGLSNFFKLYMPMTTTWQLFDGSQPDQLKCIATGEGSRIQTVDDPTTWTQIERTHAS